MKQAPGPTMTRKLVRCCDMSQDAKAAARLRKQRQRDKVREAGKVKVEVWVAAEHADAVRKYAKSFPDPAPPVDPRQLDLLAQERFDEDAKAAIAALDRTEALLDAIEERIPGATKVA